MTFEGLCQFIQQSKVGPCYRSDHTFVTLELNFTDNTHGKSYWKHNNSLLTDLEYLKIINKTNLEVKKQYALPVHNIDEIETISDTEIQFTINDQTFLDVLLMELRGKSISYGSFKKKQRNNQEKEIISKTTILESNINVNNVEELDKLKTELYDIRQEKLKAIL